MEGTGIVTLADGESRTLHAGQMVYVLPNHTGFGPLLNINLGKLVSGSALVNGFAHPLPSLPLVEIAVHDQDIHLIAGQLTDTGTPADKLLQSAPTPYSGLPQAPNNGPPSAPTGSPIVTYAPYPTITPPVDGQPPPPFGIPGFTIQRPPQLQPPFGP